MSETSVLNNIIIFIGKGVLVIAAILFVFRWLEVRRWLRDIEQAASGMTDDDVLRVLREYGRSMNAMAILRAIYPRDKLAQMAVGTLYPKLIRLERAGAITSRWIDGPYPRKRVYEIAK